MLGEVYWAHPALAWLGLAAALLAVEVLTGSGWLLWAAASAGVIALAAAGLGDLPIALAIAGFALLTLVSTLAARRYLPRSATAQPGDINDNTARLVGHQGRAVVAFEGGAGRVFIDGKEWAAEQDGDAAPGAGAQVEVTGVSGAHLKVRLL